MSAKHWLLAGAVSSLSFAAAGLAGADSDHKPATGLVRAVRIATADFRDVSNAGSTRRTPRS